MTSLAHQPMQPMRPMPPGPPGLPPTHPGAQPQMRAPVAPLCHVTIVAPRRRVDLALPADIPLPHVLPGLLRAVGEAGGDAAGPPGWVLQRLGGAPFDLGQTLASLGVLDGELLYLRPRELTLPPALFDDVADVVATGVKDSSGKWEARHTRAMGAGAAAIMLALGAPALVLSGSAPLGVTVVAGMLALLLVGVSAALSRAVGDSSAGALIGYAALPYAFLAGLYGLVSGSTLSGLGAPHLLAALTCTALVATIGGTVVADGVAGFLGTAIATVAGALASAVVMVFAVPAAGVAAMTVTILIAFSPLIPTLSFRIARVPLPALPTNAEELRADNQRLDSEGVLARTAQARRYATGMVVGIVLTAIGAMVFLVTTPTWMAVSMTVVLSLVLLLRARVFHGLGQRLWLLGTGLAGLIAVGIELSAGAGTVAAAAVVMGVLWLAMLVVGLGLWLPSGRLSPFWGRAGEIVDVILLIALFPLALGVLDVYTWIRGLAG
ncbi:type VII secretion integral membrane protein EccD [Nonomuraea angiospora]|uniref:Type VII secretion integral membrane protein EccD n=1 Tax=Nonomuraea angiospora TaxID=46172 RepID=A0ABR9MBC5_9ACTN|nr:type VII secretion integral membrane protein EccD [Nonomuraea angiospora]MBE1590213.1 type VII secretion integral membrane protein EccD [Nonomuraea angiospora]